MINHVDINVRNNAQNHPDKKVLFRRSKKDNSWTGISWKEAISEVDELTASLLDRGIESGQKIAIFSQNSIEWILADLAIMSCRATVVPIYATNSSNEASYILNDAEVEIVFAGNQEILERLYEIEGKTRLKLIIATDPSMDLKGHALAIHWKDFKRAVKKSDLEKIKAIQKEAKLEDLASLIYTSGTTGEPKGVMLDHGNFMASLEAHDYELSVEDGYRSLSLLPLSHIYEHAWVFYCLHRGIEVYLNEDPKQMADVLKEVKPNIMCAVPRLFEKIYAAIMEKRHLSSGIARVIFDWSTRTGARYQNDFLRWGKQPGLWLKFKHGIADKLVLKKIRAGFGGEIKFMPCGGAALAGNLVAFFHGVGIRIICGYGLTETTATATLFGDTGFDFGSAGRPLKGTEIKIGENDEILVKGPGVMKGYYKKPEATSAVFEGQWFKTGDAGRIDSEGNLTITDRIKDLIKTSGGKYVAPQKLEKALVSDEMIEQIAVIGEKRNFITALAVPSFENLKNYADEHKITYKNLEELVSNADVIKMMNKRFERLQKDFSGFEKIKKFTLLPKEFTMDSGELTSTLKIKRKVIQERYKKLIDKMYQSKK